MEGSTFSSLKAVVQQVRLCSSSAHSIFSSLHSLLALLGWKGQRVHPPDTLDRWPCEGPVAAKRNQELK